MWLAAKFDNVTSDTENKITNFSSSCAVERMYVGSFAEAGDADLVVKGVWGEVSRGALYSGQDSFRTDRAGEPALSRAQLLALVDDSDSFLTFTAVPPGNGTRIGIDRDLDGTLDADEKSSPTTTDVVAPSDEGMFGGGAMTMPLSFALLALSLFGVRLLRRR